MKKGTPSLKRPEVFVLPLPKGRTVAISASTTTSSAQYTLEARSFARGSMVYIDERTT
jgi:hypothetical protein